MTHRELVIMQREFYPHETHFFSLFLKRCHIIKNAYIRGNLLSANEIYTENGLIVNFS